MHAALRMLRDGKRVHDVAEAMGYDSESAFSRAFMKERSRSAPGNSGETKLRTDPLGPSPDPFVGFGRSSGREQEAVLQPWDDVEPDLDAGLRGAIGEPAAIIDQQLFATYLDVERRKPA